MPAVPDFQIPSWQPGIKDPMHARDFGQLAPAVRPTAASVENLLRKALATTTPDEICIVYFPPEEIRFSPETRERIDDCTSFLPEIETDFLFMPARKSSDSIPSACSPGATT